MTMKSKVPSPMKLSPAVASRTLQFLRRTIPKGHAEADELLDLIMFYERALQSEQGKNRHRE
jgi:hypothetical protein